jgi:hypothetical protein
MPVLSDHRPTETRRRLMRGESAANQRRNARGFGRFRADPSIQDAPRAWMSNNERLAITRLASPNSVNNCPWFLAIPL